MPPGSWWSQSSPVHRLGSLLSVPDPASWEVPGHPPSALHPVEALAWAAAKLMEQLRAGAGREEVSSKAWPFLTHHFGTAPSSMTLLCGDTGRIFTMSPSSRQELASLPCRPCCRLGGTPRGVEVGGDPICSQSWLLQHGPWCEAGELLPGMPRFS